MHAISQCRLGVPKTLRFLHSKFGSFGVSGYQWTQTAPDREILFHDCRLLNPSGLSLHQAHRGDSADRENNPRDVELNDLCDDIRDLIKHAGDQCEGHRMNNFSK